ncbi:hypothetical protein AGMMS49965_09160 [Bacteroidia bacterium]|nr:hypothetical protein AGMMS49965_09160 [Bacteroidia bacterium]
MKTKKMYAMALAAVLVGTSCTRDDLNDGSGGGGGGTSGGGNSNPPMVFLNGSVGDLSGDLRLMNVPKRGGTGSAVGSDSAVFERGDRIGIYMVDTISNRGFLNVLRANVPYMKMYGDTFMLATGTDSIRLPTSGRVKFFAYYPWDANTAWPDIYWSVADQTDQSKLDLMVASNNGINAAGFGKMYIGDTLNFPTRNVDLKFRHMLSKITIHIRAGDGANIDQNSIAQVTMGVIQGTHTTTQRIQSGDTVPLGATFHMIQQPTDTAYGGMVTESNPLGRGYMDPVDKYTKMGVISFYPSTNRSRYTALVIPHNYAKKNIAIELTEKGQTPEGFMAPLPDNAWLRKGNQHYIVTATLEKYAVRFDNVTIQDWDVVAPGTDNEIIAK